MARTEWPDVIRKVAVIGRSNPHTVGLVPSLELKRKGVQPYGKLPRDYSWFRLFGTFSLKKATEVALGLTDYPVYFLWWGDKPRLSQTIIRIEFAMAHKNAGYCAALEVLEVVHEILDA